MSKLRIEKGASKVRRAPLKVTINGDVADDLELMGEWSENDSSYLVNLLLEFAIAQSEDFQRYKSTRSPHTAGTPDVANTPVENLRKVRSLGPSAPPFDPLSQEKGTSL